MTAWELEFLPEAEADYDRLDGSQRAIVDKAIKKIRSNPLPKAEGGYGIPLGNKSGRNLTNYLEVKLKKHGIRIVYYVIRTAKTMKIVVIGARKDSDVYEIANKRIVR